MCKLTTIICIDGTPKKTKQKQKTITATTSICVCVGGVCVWGCVCFPGCVFSNNFLLLLLQLKVPLQLKVAKLLYVIYTDNIKHFFSQIFIKILGFRMGREDWEVVKVVGWRGW